MAPDSPKPLPQPGRRVECLLHRGEAAIYYPGTVLLDGGVLLDDYPYGNAIVEPKDIAAWRYI